MKDLREELEEAEKSFNDTIKEIKSELKVSEKITQRLLNKCGKSGITRVSIGKRNSKVPASQNWSFYSCHNSVFTWPEGVKDKEGWPVIWGIVDELKIDGGCGNSNQKQVSDNANLMEGVYELKNRQWRRID